MTPTLTRRTLTALTAVAACAALATPAAHAQSLSLNVGAGTACTEASPQEIKQIITDVHENANRERVTAGVKPVERQGDLEKIAQDWSQEMADDDRMSHNPEIRPLVDAQFPGQWRGYGENVLQTWCGADGAKLVNQWMNSFPHRLNLLNPAHTHLGVGVAIADSGKLYSTQNFVNLK